MITNAQIQAQMDIVASEHLSAGEQNKNRYDYILP